MVGVHACFNLGPHAKKAAPLPLARVPDLAAPGSGRPLSLLGDARTGRGRSHSSMASSNGVGITLIMDALKGGDDSQKEDALGNLAQIMDTSYGEDAEALCEYLRIAGGVALIAGLLAHAEPGIHQTALLLIGNIASDAVDPKAALTKKVLKRINAFDTLLGHLYSSDWMTLVYALGAVQNTCTEFEYVERMQEMGAVGRLQELVRAGDPQLEQYAKGCLANMRQTILVSATKKHVRSA